MPSLGPLEILVVAAIALIVFGPEKLPDIARTVGRAASQMRRMASEFREEFESGLEPDEDDEDFRAGSRSDPRGRPRGGPDDGRPSAAPGGRAQDDEPEPPTSEVSGGPGDEGFDPDEDDDVAPYRGTDAEESPGTRPESDT